MECYPLSYELGLIRASAARQRLDPLYVFARLLINGCIPEVDVPVQARVRVVLVVGCCVEGIAGWRYSVLVHIHGIWPAPFASCEASRLIRIVGVARSDWPQWRAA